MTKKIGVLALQGSLSEHRQALESLGCEVVEIRKPSDLIDINGLVIPGEESTTLSKLLQTDKLGEKIKELASQNLPIFGTCAGMIVLSKNIENSDLYSLGLMDVKVQSNAFVSQVANFETHLEVPALGKDPIRAVFIRAPYIKEVAPNVGILAEYEGKIVFARQGNMIASAFHPELTEDRRVHQYFLSIVDEQLAK